LTRASINVKLSIINKVKRSLGLGYSLSRISALERNFMPLSKEQKDRIIKKHRVHDTDTGSAEVQIAILTEEIKQLTVHMKEHKHDYSSRLGLIKKVQERKKLMDYLKRENAESLLKIAKELKLKIAQQRESNKE
jgi:small subunit ribosomal protein S15